MHLRLEIYVGVCKGTVHLNFIYDNFVLKNKNTFCANLATCITKVITDESK